MPKAVLVVLDGLRYATARDTLGWLEGMVRAGAAEVRAVQAELPAMSRPLYETLLTGRAPVEHGIVSNAIVRASRFESVFSRARAAGLVTAAAAYSWVAELVLGVPWDRERGRIVLDHPGAIQHGIFYWDDRYPDSHLLADADWLLRSRDPDFLLVHPMNIDDAGHRAGGDSKAYRDAARSAGDLLARYLPHWLDTGRRIVVTADHGMGDDGSHAGPTRHDTEVPLYTLGFGLPPDHAPAQTELAGLLCRLIEIDPGSIPPCPAPVLPLEPAR